LERRQRALVAIAGFTALRMPEQVAKIGQSALNAGLSQAQMIEAIIQTAPLTGFPPALVALGAIGAACRVSPWHAGSQPRRLASFRHGVETSGETVTGVQFSRCIRRGGCKAATRFSSHPGFNRHCQRPPGGHI
jgi:phage tail tape-measure protein